MTLLHSVPITHLWSLPIQTNVLQIISFHPFLNLYSFQLCAPAFFLALCYYPCRAVTCCRAQTETVLTSLSFLHVYIKVADLNGIPFHFLCNELGHQTSPSNLSSFLNRIIQPTLSHNFFLTQTLLSVPPSLKPYLTWPPPVLGEIKKFHPQLFKASFLSKSSGPKSSSGQDLL